MALQRVGANLYGKKTQMEKHTCETREDKLSMGHVKSEAIFQMFYLMAWNPICCGYTTRQTLSGELTSPGPISRKMNGQTSQHQSVYISSLKVFLASAFGGCSSLGWVYKCFQLFYQEISLIVQNTKTYHFLFCPSPPSMFHVNISFLCWFQMWEGKDSSFNWREHQHNCASSEKGQR